MLVGVEVWASSNLGSLDLCMILKFYGSIFGLLWFDYPAFIFKIDLDVFLPPNSFLLPMLGKIRSFTFIVVFFRSANLAMFGIALGGGDCLAVSYIALYISVALFAFLGDPLFYLKLKLLGKLYCKELLGSEIC